MSKAEKSVKALELNQQIVLAKRQKVEQRVALLRQQRKALLAKADDIEASLKSQKKQVKPGQAIECDAYALQAESDWTHRSIDMIRELHVQIHSLIKDEADLIQALNKAVAQDELILRTISKLRKNIDRERTEQEDESRAYDWTVRQAAIGS